MLLPVSGLDMQSRKDAEACEEEVMTVNVPVSFSPLSFPFQVKENAVMTDVAEMAGLLEDLQHCNKQLDVVEKGGSHIVPNKVVYFFLRLHGVESRLPQASFGCSVAGSGWLRGGTLLLLCRSI